MGTRMRIYLLAIALSSCLLSFSQGFKVKVFKQNVNDGSAFHAPLDADGHPCGLIKIRSDNPELQFKGNILGDVENKMNEYWVFVSQGSKSLTVCHPNFIPFVITYADYSIEISSKATYVLTLEETKFKKEKTGLTIVVKPENADLYIDDVFIDNLSGNGFYQLYLPKGEHICKLSKAGYRTNVQVVQTGKAAQNINVELESMMAELEVKCKTATAEIFIDSELKGNGIWRGKILAGEHKIEVRQQNFNTHSQIVNLEEKENKAIVVPELKRSMGKILIETVPSNLPVMVDGKSVGISPCTIDIETGKHYVSSEFYGLVPYRSEFEIENDIIKTLSVNMQYKEGLMSEDYKKAYQGNLNAILGLVCEVSTHGNYEEAFYWINKHPQHDYLISHWTSYWKSKNDDETPYGYWNAQWIEIYSVLGYPEKALELYPIAKADEEGCGGLFMSDLNMNYIGEAFLKKKEYDKAIQCFEKADNYGYEGLGDCYVAKGDKQRAAIYYKKCLSLDYYDERNRVERKLKDLGY